jgi:hypothetical protein
MSSQYGAMLREGLATEFPFAKRAVERLVVAVRSPEVSREAPVWAAVSAFGAGWAVGAVGQVLATGLRVAGLRDPSSWFSGGFAILGYAVAIAVALRAGGRRGLVWYLALLAIQTGLQIALSVPGFLTFCERSGECSPLRFVVPYVYLATGLLVAVAVVRAVRSAPAGPNAFLSGAGVLALSTTVTGLAFFFVHPQDPVAASAMSFVLSGGTALAAGIVLRLRSPEPAPAALLAGAILLTWLAFAGPFIASVLRDGTGGQVAAFYLSGPVDVLTLAAGWLATAARQRDRTTAAA